MRNQLADRWSSDNDTSPAAPAAPGDVKSGDVGALRLERFLPYRLSVLSNRISRMIAKDYAQPFELSIAQWRVMVILAERGEASATQVADAGQLDKVAVSRAVKVLIERGFLVRAASQEDGRIAVLKLTALGRGVFERVAPMAMRREHDLLAALSPGQRAALDEIIDALDAQMTELEGVE